LVVESTEVDKPTVHLLWRLLKSNEKKSLGGLFVLMLIGTLLETLSVGLLIPVLAVLTSETSEIKLPFVTLNTDIDKNTLIWIVVVGVFIVYVVKNMFLGLRERAGRRPVATGRAQPPPNATANKTDRARRPGPCHASLQWP
jgi:ABC-type multidrug transport system fused ATPase/permease subunit